MHPQSPVAFSDAVGKSTFLIFLDTVSRMVYYRIINLQRRRIPPTGRVKPGGILQILKILSEFDSGSDSDI